MKQFILLIFLTSLSYGQTQNPISLFVEHSKTTKDENKNFHELSKSGRLCSWNDFSCLEAQHEKKEITDAQSLMDISTARSTFVFQSRHKIVPCDRVCSTTSAASLIDLQLKLASKVRLSNYFAYKNLPADNPQAQLIRASEDLYTFLIIKNMQRSLKNLYPQLDFTILPESELKKRILNAPAQIDSLHTNELYKGRVFDSLSEVERLKVYQNVLKRKPREMDLQPTFIIEFMELLKKIPK